MVLNTVNIIYNTDNVRVNSSELIYLRDPNSF